jgi:hypothetical protein
MNVVDGPDPRDEAPRFTEGSFVEWVGPADLGADFHLEHGHPGVVDFPEPLSMIVRWVDKSGWFNHEGIFLQEWLAPLSPAEFDRRAAELRESDWPGFPPGDY